MKDDKHAFVKKFIEYVLKKDIEDSPDYTNYFFYPKFLKLIINNLNEEHINKENIERLYSYFCDLYEYTKDIQKINKIDKNLPFELNYNYVCFVDGVDEDKDFFAFNINLDITSPFKTFAPSGAVSYSFHDKEDFKKIFDIEAESNLVLYLSLFNIALDDDDVIDVEEALREIKSRYNDEDDDKYYRDDHDDYDGAEESDSFHKLKSTITLYL